MCDQGRGGRVVSNITQGTTKKNPRPSKHPLSALLETRILSSSLSLRSDTTITSNTTELNNMMDVTFVLEESGVTATVEVPCEAKVAAAKEVACTALAVSTASVEMRIGTQVLEGTCRLQDTAFGAGVQVVLARRFADIKCPAEYSVDATDGHRMYMHHLSLSSCGALCLVAQKAGFVTYVTGLDTETFSPTFKFKVDGGLYGEPAISRCKTRCYLACRDYLLEVVLPDGEVVRKVDGPSHAVFSSGGFVVSSEDDVVSVYDEDLTLLRTLSHKGCRRAALSDCGGWVITSSYTEKKARLWDVNTGEAVACVPAEGVWCAEVALSRSASVCAVVSPKKKKVHLYDSSGAAIGSVDVGAAVAGMHFTPCGKYLVVRVTVDDVDREYEVHLHQYDVTTMSCVRVMPPMEEEFAISPCSRVVVSMPQMGVIVTRHLYPHNSE